MAKAICFNCNRKSQIIVLEKLAHGKQMDGLTILVLNSRPAHQKTHFFKENDNFVIYCKHFCH